MSLHEIVDYLFQPALVYAYTLTSIMCQATRWVLRSMEIHLE